MTQQLNALVESIDLSMVKMKIRDPEDGKGWTSEEADRVETLYKRFLFMIALGNHVVPTKEIDAMWHFHILDTRAYAHDCQKVFGRFIHHFPYLGMRGEDDVKLLASEFAKTKTVYERMFGEPYSKTKNEASHCDDGYTRCSSTMCIGSCTSVFSQLEAELKTKEASSHCGNENGCSPGRCSGAGCIGSCTDVQF